MVVDAQDWPRIIELVWTYRDLPLGTVDASVIALAERPKIRQIATLDHRHFSVVRPAHVEAFELLPRSEWFEGGRRALALRTRVVVGVGEGPVCGEP